MTDELIERLEKATGPDRDLDFEIDVALAPPGHAAHWEGQRTRIYVGIPHNEYNEESPHHRKKGSKDEIPSPPYTSSIDAAVKLVEEKLPGWGWSTGWSPEAEACEGRLFNPKQRRPPFSFTATRTTNQPALALCIALLKALRAADKQGGGG